MAISRLYQEAAISVALAGTGVGGRNHHAYRIGAVIVKGKTVVAARSNSYRENRYLRSWPKYIYMHAELAAISSRGMEACDGTSLYVARVRRDGSLGMAKPCEHCQKLIAQVGIKRVYYTSADGNFIQL